MTKRNKAIYWVATGWLALGMLSTGVVQLLQAKEVQGALDMITHQGYPAYLLSLLGVCKVLGVVAVLVPGFTLVKEWAYAGFFFMMSGAIFSHIATGDPISAIVPALLLLALTIVSWYFRPENRKLSFVNQ